MNTYTVYAVENGEYAGKAEFEHLGSAMAAQDKLLEIGIDSVLIPPTATLYTGS